MPHYPKNQSLRQSRNISKSHVEFPRQEQHPIGYLIGQDCTPGEFIPAILQVAWVLAFLAHPNHIVAYAPGDSQTGRLQATRIILGIYPSYFKLLGCWLHSFTLVT
jgi:hypothetical protein